MSCLRSRSYSRGGALPQLLYVFHDHALLAVKKGQPAVDGGQGHPLQQRPLGDHPFGTPLVVVVEQTAPLENQVGAVGRQVAAQLFEHRGNGLP